MSCDHILGVNFGGYGQCDWLTTLSAEEQSPSFRKSSGETPGQAAFGSLDQPFQFCPACGQPNELFIGLFPPLST